MWPASAVAQFEYEAFVPSLKSVVGGRTRAGWCAATHSPSGSRSSALPANR